MDMSADSFMTEVRNNFLLCKLCGGEFNTPKTLPCMHTFCLTCLTSYADESKQSYRYSTYCKPISCPVCRRRTDITRDDVSSLPDNFLLSSLTGLIKYKSEEMTSCQICSRRPKGRKPTATKRCLECNKQLCKRCVVQHQETRVTKNHTLCSLDSAQKLMCSEHEESIRFICKTCSICVCVYCTHTSHKGHDIMSVGDGLQTCQQQIDSTIDNCNRRVDSLTSQLHSIQGWELCYNETKELILNTAAGFQTQVENQKQLTLAKLDELYGAEVLDMINKKDQLTESLQGLTEACKFEKVTPDEAISLEAILIQNEIQNKVKHLLSETTLAAASSLPPPELSVSFEKGGFSLGALIATQEDTDEPLYYDADETEDTLTASQNWCRSCRSRSRSRSRGADMSRRLQGMLNPVTSDTDVSLTDVSALGTVSPQFSKHNFSSLASDTDDMAETEAHKNPDAFHRNCELDNESIDMMLSTVPDVVPSTRQTEEAGIQYELVPMSSNFQTTQTDPPEEKVVTEDVGCQHESIETEMKRNVNSCLTMTNLRFSSNQNGTVIAEDTGTGQTFQLVPLTRKLDQMTMTHQPNPSADKSTATTAPQRIHISTSTSVDHKDVSLNPIRWPVTHISSQTSSPQFKESMTNTESSIVGKDVETNTEARRQSEKFSQTFVRQVLTRGVTARPSIAELGINVKPTLYDSSTNTETRNAALQDLVHKSTNTLCPASVSVGVSAHMVGVHHDTSTSDLVQILEAGVQTKIDSKAVGCEAKVNSADNFTNTKQVTHKTVACGTELPRIPLVSTGAGTDPLPALRDKGVNVTQSRCDAWTSPVKKSVSNKACGTERVKLRNVGLYVRPLSVNSSSMTESVISKDASCGSEEPRLQSHKLSDTKGLIKYFNRQTNTQTPSKAEMRTKHSQTRVITLSDNCTAMFPSVSVDKSTNTPHQIRQQLLDHFQLSNASAQLQSRAVQTEWAVHECPSCLPAIDVGPLGMRMTPETNGSMLTMEPNHQHLRFAPPQNSLIGTKKRQHSLPAQLAPAMCDKFTNTGSLSTLLHPEKSSTDCVDNKISECIIKLRQVTRKLQKSSNDVSRSENFMYTTESGNLGTISPGNPPAEGVTPMSRSDTVISGTASPWEWQDDSSEQSTSTAVSESHSPRGLITPEILINPDSGAHSQHSPYHPPLVPPLALHHMTRTDNTPRSYGMVRSRPKRFGSSAHSDEVFTAYEQDNLSPPHSDHAGHSQSPVLRARSRSSSGQQWDLKSLVLEEDRIKGRHGKSNEQLNMLGAEREGQPMLPVESKIHRSTENLNFETGRDVGELISKTRQKLSKVRQRLHP